MDEQNLHSEFLNGDELPINIPSPDEAWKNMRRRLDEEMPKGGGWFGNTGGSNKWLLRSIALFALLMISFITLVIVIQKKKNGTENISGISTRSEQIIGEKKDEPGEGQNIPAQKDDTKDQFTDKNKQPVKNSNPVNENKIDHNISATDTDKKLLRRNIAALENNLNNNNEKAPFKNNPAETVLQLIDNKNIEGNNQQLNASPKSISWNNNSTANQPPINDSTASPSAGNIFKTDDKRNLQSELQEDSAEEDNTDEQDSLQVQAGLQWNVQLPTSNTGNNFAGPNTQSQPYRLLLPGLWLNLQSEKSLFSIEVNPFYSNILPAKAFSNSTSLKNNGDTLITAVQAKTLNKLFGVSAGFGYAYNVGGNWWTGGSLLGSFWSKGVATSEGTTEKSSMTNSFPTSTTTFKNSYSINDSDWTSFSKFQMNISAQIFYRKKLWQSGLRFGVPVMPLAKNQGPVNPLHAELFFRLKLLDKKIKK